MRNPENDNILLNHYSRSEIEEFTDVEYALNLADTKEFLAEAEFQRQAEQSFHDPLNEEIGFINRTIQ